MDTRAPQSAYIYSGRFEPKGLAILFGGGAGAAAVLGLIYGFASEFMPFVYFTILLTVFTGVGIGWITSRAAFLGHVRNTRLTAYAAAVAGLVALYTSWITWTSAAGVGDPILPGEILDSMSDIARRGIWEIAGIRPSGAFLYLIWLVEAGILISASVVSAERFLRNKVYCENCAAWAAETSVLEPIELDRLDAALPTLLQGDVASFCRLDLAPADATAYAQLALTCCGTCDELTVADLNLVTVKGDPRTSRERPKELVAQHILLTPDARARLNAFVERVAVGT